MQNDIQYLWEAVRHADSKRDIKMLNGLLAELAQVLPAHKVAGYYLTQIHAPKIKAAPKY